MNIPNNQSSESEIDFSEIISLLWSEKKLIIKAFLVSGLFSILVALSLSNYYKSSSILEIAETSSSMSGLGQYGDLASVVGISLPSNSQNKATRVIETIKSRDFISHLLRIENFAPALMAADGFDPASGEIIFDSSRYDVKDDKWKSSFFSSGSSKPTDLDIHRRYIKDIISVSQDRRSGLITISVEHLSPVFAKKFLDLIIDEANSLLREKDLKDSSEALLYLESQLSKTSLIEMKDSLNKLIQVQLETQMLANVSSDYVLKAIEPPYLPEKKSRPSRAIICIITTMVGTFLAFALILVRHFIKK
tara:strand:+ start:253 stop:1170 length:918 start_codon:yes stop_codon:yes gene_type:complete